MKKELIKCPDCGGEVTYYHSSIMHGDGITRVVCAKKCQGWKVIKEIDRNISADLKKEIGMKAKKYIIRPGYVVSRYDGQEHYISASALMNLYGVRISECVIIRSSQDYYKLRGFKRELINLAPRTDGIYDLHSVSDRSKKETSKCSKILKEEKEV